MPRAQPVTADSHLHTYAGGLNQPCMCVLLTETRVPILPNILVSINNIHWVNLHVRGVCAET